MSDSLNYAIYEDNLELEGLRKRLSDIRLGRELLEAQEKQVLEDIRLLGV